MGRIDHRLRALEGKLPPNPCPVCSDWFAITVNGELDTLTRDGIEADECQRAEYLEQTHWAKRNGGACVVCGKAPLEIRIPGLASPEFL